MKVQKTPLLVLAILLISCHRNYHNENIAKAGELYETNIDRAKTLLKQTYCVELIDDKDFAVYIYLSCKISNKFIERLPHTSDIMNMKHGSSLDKVDMSSFQGRSYVSDKKYKEAIDRIQYLKQEQQFFFILFMCALIAFLIMTFIFHKFKYRTRIKITLQDREINDLNIKIQNMSLELEKKKMLLEKSLDKNKQEYENRKNYISGLDEKAKKVRHKKLISSSVGKKITKLANLNIPGQEKELITKKIWKEIEKEIDLIYFDFRKRLYNMAPNLAESEWQYCCLHLFKLDSNQEAILLNINPDSVRKRKTRIRRKLGLLHDKSNLYSFFVDDLLNN